MMKNSFYFLFVLFPILFVYTACENNNVNSETDNEPPNIHLPSDIAPLDLFYSIIVMFDNISSMDSTDIEELTTEELIEIAKPFLHLWEDTSVLSSQATNELKQPLQNLADLSRNGELSKNNHRDLVTEINAILSSGKPTKRTNLEDYLDDIKQIFIEWNRDQSPEYLCTSLFNVSEHAVFLIPGDNFSVANHYCPENTLYFIGEGTHIKQSVKSPKPRTLWIGTGEQSILQGSHEMNTAFSERMTENTYSFFQIVDYIEFGILTDDKKGNKNIDINNMIFKNIAGEKTGEKYGAIKVEWGQHISIRKSYFENVASSIRLVNSEGPLEVIDNRAINSGRNFFQCDKCNGSKIQINNNIVEFKESYGVDILEDYINIYQSNGTAQDWIQVHENYARGHDGSLSGSFIILGDSGGSYQEAVGNIGINPGQVGIGIAGGVHIKVEGNIMYSDPWPGSNVAYYSAAYTTPCNNHQFPGPTSSIPNKANWMVPGEKIKPYWTDEKCGIDNISLRDSILHDPSLNATIWPE